MPVALYLFGLLGFELRITRTGVQRVHGLRREKCETANDITGQKLASVEIVKGSDNWGQRKGI